MSRELFSGRMIDFCQRLCQHAEDEATRLQVDPDDVPGGFDEKPRPLDLVIPFVSKRTRTENELVGEYIHRCNHGQDWSEHTRHDGTFRPEVTSIAGTLAEFGESLAMDELLDVLKSEYPTEAAEIRIDDFKPRTTPPQAPDATTSPGPVQVTSEVHIHLPTLSGEAEDSEGKTDSENKKQPDAKSGNTWQSVEDRAVDHVKSKGGKWPGYRALANVCGCCSTSTVSKAVKNSKYLAARLAEHKAEKAAKRTPTELIPSEAEQCTFADPAATAEVSEQLARLANEQTAEIQKDNRQQQRCRKTSRRSR